MDDILLIPPKTDAVIRTKIILPASKSISNRWLILRHLSGNKIRLSNLSDAEDTIRLATLLEQNSGELDAGHGGTTFRFLLAVKALEGCNCVLTGSERLQKRPMKALFDALRQLGAEFEFPDQPDAAPVRIVKGIDPPKQKVTIDGSVSSQFITALMLIAPRMQQGLEIEISGNPVSESYLKMTMKILKDAGVRIERDGSRIRIHPSEIKAGEIAIQPDWSSAAYWFSIAGLSKEADIFLSGLKKDGLQGDEKVAEILEEWGIFHVVEADGLRITKKGPLRRMRPVINFADMPDQAQTLIPFFAACGCEGTYTGLETLRGKESDRIVALQEELAGFGISFREEIPGKWKTSGEFSPGAVTIDTRHDHRMALGFAPLALAGCTLRIKDPRVIAKSYPEYWNDLKKAGIL